MNGIEVSFVIVSWNVADLLRDCIQTIVDTADDISYEVIVVDNNSSDASLNMLRSEFPWVQVIENHENVGFARANNQGFELARGKYVFILNPDTRVEKYTLRRLKDYLDEHPETGAVSPKLVYPDGLIQYACARLLPGLGTFLFCYALRMDKLPGIGGYFNRKFISPYKYDITQPVEAISGAAILIRGHLIKALGGFDGGYIHTGEDIDLCYRIRKEGWVLSYVSDAVVVHVAGQSSKQSIVWTTINTALSGEQYFKKCKSKGAAFTYRLIVQCVETPVSLLINIFKFLARRLGKEEVKKSFSTARGIWKWERI